MRTMKTHATHSFYGTTDSAPDWGLHRPERLDAWIGPKTYRAIAAAVDKHGTAFLRPIFEDVDGKISYDQIRVVVAHLNATQN